MWVRHEPLPLDYRLTMYVTLAGTALDAILAFDACISIALSSALELHTYLQ